MTYYGSKGLSASFRTVRGNTIRIAEEISESHDGFRAAPDTRTIGQTLVHIALIPKRMLGIVPHLTRQMQERMAQALAQAARAR